MDRNKKKWARNNYAEAEKHLSKEEAILSELLFLNQRL